MRGRVVDLVCRRCRPPAWQVARVPLRPVHRGRQQLGKRGPFFRARLHAPLDKFLKLTGHRPQARTPLGTVQAVEFRLDAGHGDDENRPKRVHVARRVDRIGQALLRRHVLGRADPHAGKRDGRVAPPGPGEPGGDPEVDHPRAVGAEHDVGRLEVPVHDAGCVNRRQRLDESEREPPAPAGRHRPGRKPLVVAAPRQHQVGERGPDDKPGGQPRLGRFAVAVQQLRDVAAADPSHRVHLPQEAFPEALVRRQVRLDDLNRDEKPRRGLAEVHAAHAAFPQAGDQLIIADIMRVAPPK